jgi:hypothetical protein
VSDAAWFGMPKAPNSLVQQEIPIKGFMGAEASWGADQKLDSSNIGEL